jgi:small subunit ribosomal protein S18
MSEERYAGGSGGGERRYGRSSGDGEGRGRSDRGDREGGYGGRGGRGPFRRKVCSFCVDKVAVVSYKDVPRLRRLVTDRGKILKSRATGTCQRHQRAAARAIKRARHLALLPFVAE